MWSSRASVAQHGLPRAGAPRAVTTAMPLMVRLPTFPAALSIAALLLFAASARADSAPPPDGAWTCGALVTPSDGRIPADLGLIRLSGAEVVIDPATAFTRVTSGANEVPVEIVLRTDTWGDTIVELPPTLEEGLYHLHYGLRGCPALPDGVMTYTVVASSRPETLGVLRATDLLATNVRRGSPELAYFVLVELSTNDAVRPWLRLWTVGLSTDGRPIAEVSLLDDRETWRVPVVCPPRGAPTDVREIAFEAAAGPPDAPPILTAATGIGVDCDSATRVDPDTLSPISDEEAAMWDVGDPPPAPPAGTLDGGAPPSFRDAAGADPDSHRREAHESCSAAPGGDNRRGALGVGLLIGLLASIARASRVRRASSVE